MSRKKGVVLSYLLMALEVLSTLLLTPFIIRSLGAAEYGVYKLSASVVAYLALLDLGIGNSVVRFTAKYYTNNDEKNMSRFIGVAQAYYALIALIALLLGGAVLLLFPTVFARGLSAEEVVLGQKLLVITICSTSFTLLTAPYPNILVGRGLFGVSKGVSIGQIVIRMTITYIALWIGMKSLAIVTINFLLTVMGRGILTAYVYLKLKLRPTLRGVDKQFIMEIVGYSTWILLQMVATQINAFADQVLLGMLVQGASVVVAVYAVGTQVVQYFQSIGGAVSGVLMPGVVAMVEHGATPAHLELEMIRIGRLSFAVLGTIFGGFCLYGNQFIQLWVGAEYVEGYGVAFLLMFAQLLIYTQSIGTQILWAKNQHKEQAILKFVIVLLNVILTVFLIQWKPLIGATIGTCISLLLGDVLVMNIVFHKKIGICLNRYYSGLFQGILPAILASVGLNAFFKLFGLSGWIGFFVNIAVYICTIILLLIFFGFNSYEKNLLTSLVFSIMHRRRRKKKS